MFVDMKRFLIACLVLCGCRPSDGGGGGAARTASGATAGTVAGTPAASIRASQAPLPQSPPKEPSVSGQDALLERADAARIQGAKNAPVWLVEISDFQCPFCKQWHDDVYPIVKREFVDAGVVRMAYVNLPLQMHANALPAAEAALCAAAQDRFWPMHDSLFSTQEKWAPMPRPAGFMDSLAVRVGVNITDWRACMSSGVMQRVVNGDKARARTSGAKSTPTFFVGDEPIEGAAPIAAFRAAIARARAKAQGGTPR
jgi:protein-disulfide isomerase